VYIPVQEDRIFPKLYGNTRFEIFTLGTIDKTQSISLVRARDNSSFDPMRDVPAESECRAALEEQGATDIKQAFINSPGHYWIGNIAGGKIIVEGKAPIPGEEIFVNVHYTGKDLKSFQAWMDQFFLDPAPLVYGS
jgi:hypothetical protein